ncbi:hypothetical protein B0A52_05413 [Exophiala mesophila]|uniref:Uncharacterized protein n=1 Tax=Exophiala mesophila TaxID=212818 RepID=A0A438N4S4_EXOME|nr:hypothetical protein B0A52_05413 [Exophiala mesophila]
MGFWPFGGGKKSRRVSQAEDQGRHALLEKDSAESSMRMKGNRSQDFGSIGRANSGQVHVEKPRRLSKQRYPSQQGAVPRSFTSPVTGLGGENSSTRRASAYEPGSIRGSDIYSQNPMSQSSIGPEEFTALPPAPTLLLKPKNQDPTLHRRKSSKRKAEDYAREREVRAMSSPIDIPGIKRPVTYSGSGPLRRDTKQVPGGLNRRLQRPASEVSLPIPENIQESDDYSSYASFKIGILAALSPRPTLTYVGNPRSAAGKQPSRIKPSIQQAIEEEPVTSRKRIDDLADELDAGGLRELMERDRRRHERKKAADRDRLHRKLQRKADRQREEENRGRHVYGAGGYPFGLGLDEMETRGRHSSPPPPTELSTTANQQQRPDPHPPKRDPFADQEASRPRPVPGIRNPFEDEKDVDLVQDPFARMEEEEETEGPPVPVKSPLRIVSPIESRNSQQPSRALTISPPISPVHRPADGRSFSQTSALGREPTLDSSEHRSDRRPSDQSSQKVSSWTNFFRRGTQRNFGVLDHGRRTPSEFSNTSRESFVRNKQAPPVVIPRTFRKADASHVPQRTMSKFREDLPELPMSPPDSRVQSPEAMVTSESLAGRTVGRAPSHSISGTLDGRSVATSSSNPALDRGHLESRAAQATGLDMSSIAPSGMVMSQSLASVDSEGSWLSGKPVKRSSAAMSHLRHSQSSIPPQSIAGAFDMDEDGLEVDDYYDRLTPGPTGRRDSLISSGRKASSTIIDLERERQHSPVPGVPSLPREVSEPPTEAWHQGLARQATIVRQPNRAKSTEGLLKEFGSETPRESRVVHSDCDEGEGVSPEGESPAVEMQSTPILRARSVEVKGHGRHISAGSARLLDIRRSSVQLEGGRPRTPTTPQLPADIDELKRPATSPVKGS